MSLIKAQSHRRISCRTGALREKILNDRRATVSPKVKTVYLLRRKSCARFWVYFFDFLPQLHKSSVSKSFLDPYQQSMSLDLPHKCFRSPLSSESQKFEKFAFWLPCLLATEISDFGHVIKGNNSNWHFTCLQ